MGNDVYKKSNTMVAAVGRLPLLERKIVDLVIMKINAKEYSEYGSGKKQFLEVSIPSTELKKYVGRNGGSFFNQLKKAASALSQFTCGIVDDEEKKFCFFSMFPNAEYDNNQFTISVNYRARPYLVSLSGNFTTFSLSTTMSFRNAHALKLYQLLKARCYDAATGRTYGHFDFTFGLAELQFALGILDPEHPAAKKILASASEKPDWEAAAAAIPDEDKSYTQFKIFNRDVLGRCRIEIENKTELSFSYEKVLRGRGGRVVGLTFHVDREGEIAELSHVDQDEAEVQRMFPVLTVAECHELFVVAKGNMDKIRYAEKVFSEKKGTIEHVAAYLKAVIRGMDSDKAEKDASSMNDGKKSLRTAYRVKKAVE